MTNSVSSGRSSSPARGKRGRLVAAACELAYRGGLERTSLADIAHAADVPVGNVYYYFKSKDDLIAAVVQARIDELDAVFDHLERGHRNPKARLKAFMQVVAEQAGSMAQFGCPHGSLATELVKRAHGPGPLAGRLVQVVVTWVEQQLRAMGLRDAHDLAVEYVASYQGTAVLASALGQPQLVVRQARRRKSWVDTLATSTDTCA